MEPIRPAIDAFVLDLLEERILTSRDFAEFRTVFAAYALRSRTSLRLPWGAGDYSWRRLSFTSRKRSGPRRRPAAMRTRPFFVHGRSGT
jgi:hypothetical protein